jgi:membrane protein
LGRGRPTIEAVTEEGPKMSLPHALRSPTLPARPLSGGRWLALARALATQWSRVDGTHLAAALAFYAVLSLTPFLLVVIAIAGYLMGSDTASHYILGQIADVAGAQTAQYIGALLAGSQPMREGVKAIVGLGVTLVGATATFAELQHGLDRIFGERMHGALGVVRTRMLAFGLVAGVAVLSIVSLMLSAAVNATLSQVAHADMGRAVAAAIANEVVGFAVLAVAFGAILRVLPECPPRRRAAWIGAIVAAALFVVGKFAIGWYLAHFALASAYGAAGAIVVVMLWIYWSSALFFAGAVAARVADRGPAAESDAERVLAGGA